jgi:hypothetical protein
MKIIERVRRSRNPLQRATRSSILKNMKIEGPKFIAQPDAGETSAVPPETQAVIQVLLSSIAGHKVKLQSVRLIEDSEPTNSWATEGRVAVQMSHNQRINHQ